MPNDFLKILEYTEVVMEMLLLEVSIEKNKDKVEILLTFEIAWNNLNRVSRFLGLPERVLVK